MYDIEDEIARPWLILYKNYKGVACSTSEDYRQFKAWTGCTPDVCELIWIKYGQLLPAKDDVCLMLNFLKCMPTQDEGASSFKISRPTYRKRLWNTLWYLYGTMNEVSVLISVK